MTPREFTHDMGMMLDHLHELLDRATGLNQPLPTEPEDIRITLPKLVWERVLRLICADPRFADHAATGSFFEWRGVRFEHEEDVA